MAWKRFPVPEFDHRSLKGMAYVPPEAVEAGAAGDGPGAQAVEPDPALLDRLAFRGEHTRMIRCALPPGGAHLLGRSYAWYNQRAFILAGNAADAEVLHDWQTPRPMNTRFGPEDGVDLDVPAVFVLSGRILGDHVRANRVMIDSDWGLGEGRAGYRIIAACDEGDDDFNNSTFEFSWPD